MITVITTQAPSSYNNEYKKLKYLNSSTLKHPTTNLVLVMTYANQSYIVMTFMLNSHLEFNVTKLFSMATLNVQLLVAFISP